MIISVKPCAKCGNDDTTKYKEYDGMLGYEAIICKKCGTIYDDMGSHEPETDKNSELYIKGE